MFTIEVELLTGRYAATAHNDRTRAEWPPHPARLFSALVAAMHEEDPVDPSERDGLLWLENQAPPSLDVDLGVDDVVGRRQVLDVFVPVNDISIVGDIERPLRETRAALERAVANREPDRVLKKAKQEVEKADAKLRETVAKQQVVDENPTSEALKTAAALLPARRTRQVRTFPVVVPARRTFALIWPDDPPSPIRLSLSQLCRRVSRLGHSSSLVRCDVVDLPRVPTMVPNESGFEVLRTIGPGQLARLEEAFERHRGVESRVLPSLPQRYGRPPVASTGQDHPGSIFSDEWILFERIGGIRPLSSRGTDLARALRDALLEQHGSGDLPDSLSGHGEDGRPSERPHLAFLSLPFVGREHADASIQGCAIVLPRGLPSSDRETLFRLVASWEKNRAKDGVLDLAGPALPPVRVRRVELTGKRSLRPQTWCQPGKQFFTATPIALDRNPGNLRSNEERIAYKAAEEARRSVGDGCERIGLPRPASVEISFAPFLQGAQPVRSFLPWPARPGRPPRVRVHAAIRFGEPVRGPLMIGAGRYFGLGLCMPVTEDRA
jgi:CRISPR-associated protein Csb2